MRLFVKPNVRKVSSTAIPVQPIEEGVKTVRSACLPGSILVHELTIPHDTVPLLTESKVTYVTQVSNSPSCPYRIISRFHRSISREDV